MDPAIQQLLQANMAAMFQQQAAERDAVVKTIDNAWANVFAQPGFPPNPCQQPTQEAARLELAKSEDWGVPVLDAALISPTFKEQTLTAAQAVHNPPPAAVQPVLSPPPPVQPTPQSAPVPAPVAAPAGGMPAQATTPPVASPPPPVSTTPEALLSPPAVVIPKRPPKPAAPVPTPETTT